MRRILLSSVAFLAAVLIVAGCGSSNSNPVNTNNGKLSGTYIFEQQLFTYYSGVGYSAGSHQHVSALVRNLAPQNALNQTSNLHRPFHNLVRNSSGVVPAQGSDPNGTGIVWGAMVGSLTFDGKGNITAGEIDDNEPQVGYFSDTVTGRYNVNANNSATIQIVSTKQGAVFLFNVALQVNGSTATGAQLVESYYDYAGNVEIGTGTMLQQSASISSASLTGNYVFGMQGETCYGCSGQTAVGDLYAAGVLAADGSGTFGSSSEADVATVFATQNMVPLTGTYGTPDTYGRSAVSLTSNGTMPQSYALYAANPSTFFLLATDSSSSNAPAWLFGQAGLQSGTFSNATLSGNYVLAENTEDLKNENYTDTYSDTYLALLSAGSGVVTGTGDTNQAGTVSSNVAYNYGGYAVQSNGRVTFAGTTPSGAPAPIFWMQDSSFGYGIDQLRGSTTTQEPGLIRLYGQPVGTGYTAASLSGYYALGTIPAATSNSVLYLAAVTSDGTANLSGVGAASYFSNYGGSGGTGSSNGQYTISPNGRGTITGTNSSIFGNGILYAVSGNQSLTMDVSKGNIAPSLQIFAGASSGLGCNPLDPRGC